MNDEIKLTASEVSSIITFTGPSWTVKGRKMVKTFEIDGQNDYKGFMSKAGNHARATLKTILAIFERDEIVLQKNWKYIMIAWRFIQDSVYRRDSLSPDGYAKEIRKLKRLRPFVMGLI